MNDSTYKVLRQDKFTARVVEYGIDMQERDGSKAAASYMAERDVPLHVALRTITRPRRRRDMDAW